MRKRAQMGRIHIKFNEWYLRLDYLKNTALTLERAKALKPFSGKKRLVFAPAKYLDLSDSEFIEKHGLKGIEFCQLPFEIYRIKG